MILKQEDSCLGVHLGEESSTQGSDVKTEVTRGSSGDHQKALQLMADTRLSDLSKAALPAVWLTC